MATSMVLDAIEQAIWTRQHEGVLDLKDVVHHTDRGSQYTSIRFTERLAEAGIQPSVGAVGSSYDNALAETINGLYKTELIRPRKPWRTIEDVELATARVGRLVQPPPPLRILRRHPARRTGDCLLRSTPETSRRLSLTSESLRTHRGGSTRCRSGHEPKLSSISRNTVRHQPKTRGQASTDVIHDNGAPGRIRTCDTRFRRAVLYPLSYEGGRAELTGRQPAPRRSHLAGSAGEHKALSRYLVVGQMRGSKRDRAGRCELLGACRFRSPAVRSLTPFPGSA